MIELILYSAFILLLVRHRFFWMARHRKISSKNSPLIMAHRGLKMNSPENTISSYKEAIAAGFDALELDILQKKDGELICSHNFDLERESNGIGWIQHTNYNKLKDIQTGVYTHPQNTQTIARLEDVLSEIPKNIFLNIEIKTHSVFDLSASKTFAKLFKKAKIKHSTLIADYSQGGLRDIDIDTKIKALQLAWIKRLFDNNYHPWKILPKCLLSKTFPHCISIFFS